VKGKAKAKAPKGKGARTGSMQEREKHLEAPLCPPIQDCRFFHRSKMEDATPLGFFQRISTCDVSLRKRQRQMRDRAMASSDPAAPLLLLPPPGPAPVSSEAMSKPSPTIVDNILGMLRSGQAFIRGAFPFRGNSGYATPPRQTPPQDHHNRPVRTPFSPPPAPSDRP
jgi:hypothetical protein